MTLQVQGLRCHCREIFKFIFRYLKPKFLLLLLLAAAFIVEQRLGPSHPLILGDLGLHAVSFITSASLNPLHEIWSARHWNTSEGFAARVSFLPLNVALCCSASRVRVPRLLVAGPLHGRGKHSQQQQMLQLNKWLKGLGANGVYTLHACCTLHAWVLQLIKE